MASNKKINVPITSMSSDEIYAELDTIESDGEEDENLLNDSDNKFIDKSLTENGGSKRDLSLSTSCLDIGNHLSDPNPTHQNQLKQLYEFPNLTLILMTIFH